MKLQDKIDYTCIVGSVAGGLAPYQLIITIGERSTDRTNTRLPTKLSLCAKPCAILFFFKKKKLEVKNS